MESVYDLICELADMIPDYGEREEEYNPLMDRIVEASTGWIPVTDTEHRPENFEMVLVSCIVDGKKSVNRAYRDNRGKWHGAGSMTRVTAWQPLPEPYEG